MSSLHRVRRRQALRWPVRPGSRPGTPRRRGSVRALPGRVRCCSGTLSRPAPRGRPHSEVRTARQGRCPPLRSAPGASPVAPGVVGRSKNCGRVGPRAPCASGPAGRRRCRGRRRPSVPVPLMPKSALSPGLIRLARIWSLRAMKCVVLAVFPLSARLLTTLAGWAVACPNNRFTATTASLSDASDVWCMTMWSHVRAAIRAGSSRRRCMAASVDRRGG